ncbi:MAG: hypothetical protein ACLP5H_14485 [Desulfomonilaceae bacterium]
MYRIEKTDIMEVLLRKAGSDHEPEALDAARRLRELSERWGISLDTLHSTSSQPTEFLRRRVRQLWERAGQEAEHDLRTVNTAGRNS